VVCYHLIILSLYHLGFNNACSISEYDGTFHGTSAHFKVTSTCGHVNTLDFPSKFNNWQQTEPIELFDAPTEKKEATPKLRMNEVFFWNFRITSINFIF
jgi:DNA topoisomerase-3